MGGAEGPDRRVEAVLLASDRLVATEPVASAAAALAAAGVPVVSIPPLPHGEPSAAWQAALQRLWDTGVSPGAVLVVTQDDQAGLRVGTATMGPGSATAAELSPLEDLGALARLLATQVELRQRGEPPAASAPPGWMLTIDGIDPDTERARAAQLTTAAGRIGWNGAPSLTESQVTPMVLATGVYDGQGADTHLLPGPVPGVSPTEASGATRALRMLDLRGGLVHETFELDGLVTRVVRFASLARPGLLVRRAEWTRACPPPARPLAAPVGELVTDEGTTAGSTWQRTRSGTLGGGIVAAVATARWPSGDPASGTPPGDRPIVEDQFTAYVAGPSAPPEPEHAASLARQAEGLGFDHLLAEHRQQWAHRWADADVVIEGDGELQLATRFALFHLMSSVSDDGEAAVGARGLTGTGYRGHVFWDADVFVLPFLAATHPPSARAMLEYRVRRLPAALATARSLGRRGARFPWESAHDGRDVTPRSARDRAGRFVAIRTGQLEEHIVADVAWAADTYVAWTGDVDFQRGPGLDLLVETARYWASRVRIDDGGAHIDGVIGPDEYHECVDDNAFTNVMARWNLRRAAELVEAVSTERDVGVSSEEWHRWRDLAEALVDGFDPDTGIYEQFRGFHDLEPLVMAEIAPRRPIAADLLLGPERVRQAQVIKQADVLMLHHLVPDELRPGTLEPNLRFYEPRTAHGSSLSPAIHAALFARAGDLQQAYEGLRVASRIDLDDLTATTGGGLHIATMGGLWQTLVQGFAGMRPRDGRLQVDPLLPPQWSGLEITARFHGSRVTVRCTGEDLRISAERPIEVLVGGEPRRTGPEGRSFRRQGGAWEASR
jgi:trehalose/maltose hydrolase-like predicted phosphorylase